jgi:hypothetical protein
MRCYSVKPYVTYFDNISPLEKKIIDRKALKMVEEEIDEYILRSVPCVLYLLEESIVEPRNV